MRDYLRQLERYQSYAPLLIRVGLGLVFVYFGIDKFLRPEVWEGWIPPFIKASVPSATFLTMSGVIEIVLGTMLIVGLLTRYAALLVAFFLVGVLATFGADDITGRDVGLLGAALSLVLTGSGEKSLDWKLAKEKKD